MTEEVGSSVRWIDRRVDEGRGRDGSSTGVLVMPASRECRDWCCPGGELKEWIGVTAGAEIAGPGIETGRVVKLV